MTEGSNAALVTFLLYTVAVFALAVLSGRVSKGKEFVGEYFLGSRGLELGRFKYRLRNTCRTAVVIRYRDRVVARSQARKGVGGLCACAQVIRVC